MIVDIMTTEVTMTTGIIIEMTEDLTIEVKVLIKVIVGMVEEVTMEDIDEDSLMSCFQISLLC
jgi:hypothetical protein